MSGRVTGNFGQSRCKNDTWVSVPGDVAVSGNRSPDRSGYTRVVWLDITAGVSRYCRNQYASSQEMVKDVVARHTVRRMVCVKAWFGKTVISLTWLMAISLCTMRRSFPFGGR